ncbi:YopT-type cysteine protease domain-containing protein [Nannocystis sp. RBIL2]|uniref:YopT-type cysteine protease domain-containing protein n=1 Tax=Nannocystis sp. RBIL2 TaxID=2996788 RepID=UPI00226F7519|nr:YopT-type cysteine protease domain-containing protein [Nannocystis sp. RBIL2]
MEGLHEGEKSERPDDHEQGKIEWPGAEDFDGSSERPDEDVEFFAEDDSPISEWIDATSLPTSHIVSIPGGSAGGWAMGQGVTGSGGQPPRIIRMSGAETTTATTTTTTTITNTSDQNSLFDPHNIHNINNNSRPGASPGGGSGGGDPFLELSDAKGRTPITRPQAKANARRLQDDYRPNLDYAFSQGKEMSRLLVRMRFGPPRGVCWTMSLDWLARKYQGVRDYGDRHYRWPLNRVTSMSKLARMHNKVGKIEGQKSTHGVIETIGGHKDAREGLGNLRTSLAFRSYGYESSPRHIANLVSAALADDAHPGLLIRLAGGPSPVGHALAIFRGPEGFTVFDPNFGAYDFASREQATRFFVRLWDDIYRSFNGMEWVEGDWIDWAPPN